MMLHTRCLLAVLVLCLSLRELSAYPTTRQIRQKRDDGLWVDEKLLLYQSEISDMVNYISQDSPESPRQLGTRLQFPFADAPLERLSVPLQTHRNVKDKRRRVSTPLDLIGGTFVSTLRSRKDEPED